MACEQVRLAFDKGEQPAVSVFWNMAMYRSDMLFVESRFRALHHRKHDPRPQGKSSWLVDAERQL
jgi:hypothetical protein